MIDIKISLHFQQDGTSPYFGALVGRVANRIAEATFEIDGEVYHISANENTTSLHGGKVGFSKRVWKGHVFSEGEDSGVMLRYESPDGEEVIHSRVLLDMSADATHVHAVYCGRCADTKSIDQIWIHLRATHMHHMHSFVSDAVYADLSHAPCALHACISTRHCMCTPDCTITTCLWCAPGVKHTHLRVACTSPIMHALHTSMGKVHVRSNSCIHCRGHGSTKQ